MPNKVEIELSAVDGLTGAFNKATSATNDLNKALAKLAIQEQNNKIMEEAKAKFASMSEAEKQAAVSAAALVEQQEKLKAQKDTPSKLAMAWTEFNSALSIAKQAIQAVKKVYDETIGATLAYDLEVRKLAQNLGISTEETSRAIQTADDFGISQGEVTSALQMMVKRGTAPSIEALAEIADRYNAIKDPIKQAALMTELLGRNWTALTPMLREGGDAIRETAASQAEGMLVTEAQAQAAEDLRRQVDVLNDQWTAFRNNFSNSVVPDLIRALDDLNKATDWFAKQEPDKLMGSIGVAAGMSADQVARLKRELEIPQTSREHLKELEEGYKKLADSYGYVIPGTRELTAEEQKAFEAYQKTNKAVENNNLYLQQQTTNTGALTTQELEFNRAIEDQKRIAGELTIATGNLDTAKNQLKTDQQNLNTAMGSEAQSAAEGMRQSFDRTLAALKIQDEAFGTHTADTKTRSKEIDDATRAFMNSPQTEADKAKYLGRLDEIKTKYSELDEKIEADKKKVGELQAVIDALHGKDIDINVRVNQIGGEAGGPWNVGGGGATPDHYEGQPAVGGAGHWHWNGTAWVIIQGYESGGSFGADQSILVGERGPEILTPSAAGNITNNYHYNMTINSNARHEQVAADYALMRALYSPGV
jgi:hypothetical protein